MDDIEIKISRIKLALVIAVLADMIEFPITLVEASTETFWHQFGVAMATVLDIIVMGVLTKLLGFHWVFWPGFFVEVIPIPAVEMFPTWVACVVYVARERKKAQQTASQSPQPRPIIDLDQIKAAGASLAARLTLPSPSPADGRAAIPVESSSAFQTTSEERLKKLGELRDKNLISQSEYDTKRQQILADI